MAPAVEVMLTMRPLFCRTIDLAAARVIRNTPPGQTIHVNGGVYM
jgi:hypothetical protein